MVDAMTGFQKKNFQTIMNDGAKSEILGESLQASAIGYRKTLLSMTWKRLAGAMLLVLLCASAAMASPKKIFLSDGDAGSAVTLDEDTVAVIEMWSNPSTGFGWRPSLPVGHNIRIVGTEFESSQPGLKGAWGKEKIYVVGASRGRSGLVLQYRRASQSKVADTVRFNFNTVNKFKETFSLSLQTAPVTAPENLTIVNQGLPSVFDWCRQNGCTAVKDQGNCGSCWAFATVGPLESLIKIYDETSVDLSEQYLISCNLEGWGCDGGNWAHDYHQWKMADGEYEAGAVMESDFTYTASDAACDPPHDKAYQIDSWEFVCGNAYCQSTVAQLKQAIYDHGPLTVAVCVNRAFQDYKGGVFNGPGCNSLNHGVALVGWDDNDGCWIMRNSWGAGWGESGYMRIKYGVSGIGSEASYVVYNGSSNPEPDPEAGATEISNGQTVSNLKAGLDDWRYFYIDLPDGASNLKVRISKGSGDADLYTRFSSHPTAYEWDCRPYRYGNYETCSYAAPRSGRWYVGLHAFQPYSGVVLRADYD